MRNASKARYSFVASTALVSTCTSLNFRGDEQKGGGGIAAFTDTIAAGLAEGGRIENVYRVSLVPIKVSSYPHLQLCG